jgi:hypothetical protein
VGHEGQFPAPEPSARYRFGQETFAGTRGNERDAPIPDLPAFEGTVEKIGSEMEACAKAAPDENAEPTTALRALLGLAGSIVLRCR